MWKTDELGIGVMVRFGVPPEESFRRLHSFGLRNCQFAGVPDSYLYGEEGRRNTLELKKRMERAKIASCSVFCSFPDQAWKRGRADSAGKSRRTDRPRMPDRGLGKRDGN